MRVAAIIFLISGLACLGWGVSLTFSQGVGIGLLLMAVFAAALLYQAYELFHNKPGARWRAILSSGALAICSGYIASVFVQIAPFPRVLLEVPEAWPIFGGAVIVSVIYAAVIVLLAFSKPRPNPAVNRTCA